MAIWIDLIDSKLIDRFVYSINTIPERKIKQFPR